MSSGVSFNCRRTGAGQDNGTDLFDSGDRYVADHFSSWKAGWTASIGAGQDNGTDLFDSGGRLNDTRPLVRMRGEGPRAAQTALLFRAVARRLGFAGTRPEVTTEAFRRREAGQLELDL